MRITISLSDHEYHVLENMRKEYFPEIKKISRMVKAIALDHSDDIKEIERLENLRGY